MAKNIVVLSDGTGQEGGIGEGMVLYADQAGGDAFRTARDERHCCGHRR